MTWEEELVPNPWSLTRSLIPLPPLFLLPLQLHPAPQAALCAHVILHIPLLSLHSHCKQLSISHSLGIGMCNKATWSTHGRKNIGKDLYSSYNMLGAVWPENSGVPGTQRKRLWALGGPIPLTHGGSTAGGQSKGVLMSTRPRAGDSFVLTYWWYWISLPTLPPLIHSTCKCHIKIIFIITLWVHTRFLRISLIWQGKHHNPNICLN